VPVLGGIVQVAEAVFPLSEDKDDHGHSHSLRGGRTKDAGQTDCETARSCNRFSRLAMARRIRR
jgi:hypothetical protein